MRFNLKPVALTTCLALTLAGCAPLPGKPDPQDPFERFNRGVYQFNDTVDRAVVRPIAAMYTDLTPSGARSCVSNIFSNFGDIWSGINSFLQGRGVDFFNTLGRVLFNTTVGLGGCFDVATANGANRIPNDFGTTLGVWGVGQGPYLVLPLIGPSTVRDTGGLLGDWVANPVTPGSINDVPVRNTVWGTYFVSKRADLLQASDTLDSIALDPYSFTRDAYLQRREALLKGLDNADLPDYEDEDDESIAPVAAQPVITPNP